METKVNTARTSMGLAAMIMLVLGLASYSVARPSAKYEPRLSIVGGKETTPHEFPWQLYLAFSFRYLNLSFNVPQGSASLLTATHALTAASCLDRHTPPRFFRAIAALHDPYDTTDSVTSKLLSIYRHEDFVSGPQELIANDIAILVLATPIYANGNTIKYATLPDDNSDQFTGQSCVISGWGQGHDVLEKGSVRVLSTETCNVMRSAAYDEDFTVDGNQICVHDDLNEVTPCTDDTGGPLTCNQTAESGSRQVVAGVAMKFIAVSIHKNPTCDPQHPAVYTRTGAYLQWIHSIVSPSSSTSPSPCCPCDTALLSELHHPANLSDTRSDASLEPKLSIYNGAPPTPHQFPWMLDLENNFHDGWNHACGASLLSAKYALTAAHCVHPWPPRSYRVTAGSHNRSDRVGVVTSKVKHYIAHPLFDKLHRQNDIAILELVTPIHANGRTIKYASLPDNDDEQFVDRTCVILGWGLADVSNERPTTYPEVLQTSSIRIITNAAATEFYRDKNVIVSSNHICAVDEFNRTGLADGDSGSPLICNYPTQHDSRQVVVGVVQTVYLWSNATHQVYYPWSPVVFARTSSYLPWIRAIIGGERPPPPAFPCCPCLPEPDARLLRNAPPILNGTMARIH